MVSSRAALERDIWHLMSVHNVTVRDAVPFLDDLLSLVDAYASSDNERVTMLRREVLHRESRPLGTEIPERLALDRSDTAAPHALRGSRSPKTDVTDAKATNPQAVDIPRHALRLVTGE